MIFTQGSSDGGPQRLIISAHCFWMFSADFSFSFSNVGNFNDRILKTLHPYFLFFLPEKFVDEKTLFYKVMILKKP